MADRSKRTEAAFGVGFLILIIILAVSGWRAAVVLDTLIDTQRTARYYAIVVEGLDSAIRDITEAETQQRGYLLTDDGSYLPDYDAALVRVQERFRYLIAFTREDRALHARVLDIEQATSKRLDQLADGIHFYRTGDKKKALELIQQGRPVARDIRAMFADLTPRYQASLREARASMATLNVQAWHAFILTSTLVAVVLVCMALLVIRDARQIRGLSDKLLHASRHDELTGLPNRAYANEWLERSVAAARRAGDKLGLLYMDLNGFKQVNDTMGHEAGDDVLIEVARTLEKTARDADFVSRLGGDEFIVIMPRLVDRGQVEAAARRFSGLLVMRGERRVGASVGAVMFPDDGEGVEALLRAGDAAMYAKKAARAR